MCRLSYNVYLIGLSSPFMATQSTVGLRVGDLVVLATDGLFDNMYEEDIAAQLAALKVRIIIVMYYIVLYCTVNAVLVYYTNYIGDS